jgi:hypothetical protein
MVLDTHACPCCLPAACLQLQMTAMTRGIYISQKTSRSLGVAAGANHPDLLFDERVQPTNAMSGEQYA